MTNNLFVYGTLMIPKIARMVVGFSSIEKAILQGYRVYGLIWCNHRLMYPAIKEEKGAVSHGILFRNLSDSELGAFDAYEGDQYFRKKVIVKTDTGSTEAWLYEWNNPEGYTLEGSWDRNHFEQNLMEDFLKSDEF